MNHQFNSLVLMATWVSENVEEIAEQDKLMFTGMTNRNTIGLYFFSYGPTNQIPTIEHKEGSTIYHVPMKSILQV